MTTKTEDIFRKVDEYLQKHDISWDKLSSCTTDGAPAMMGKRTGLLVRMKELSPHMIGNHCYLHRQSLSSKNMPAELADVFETVVVVVVVVVNFVKSSATNTRLFRKLCEE